MAKYRQQRRPDASAAIGSKAPIEPQLPPPIEFMRVARASEFNDGDVKIDKDISSRSKRECLKDGFSVEIGQYNHEPAMIRKRKKQDLSDSDTASSRDDMRDGKDIRVKEENSTLSHTPEENVERGGKKKNKKSK